MTPPHGTNTSDSGEHASEYLTREGGKLLVAEHNDDCHEKGALAELRKWVTKLALWQATATGIAALVNGIFMALFAYWLSSRMPAPQPSRASSPTGLINQAHADERKSP